MPRPVNLSDKDLAELRESMLRLALATQNGATMSPASAILAAAKFEAFVLGSEGAS